MRKPELDLDFARANFPAFAEPNLRPWAYFDNAAATFTVRYAIWRLARFYKERHMMPGGPADPARQGGEEVRDAQISLAQMLGVQTDEVAIGPSTAQNSYVIAQAMAERLGPGDSVLVSDLLGDAVAAPWRRLAHRGVRVLDWPAGPDGGLVAGTLGALIDDGTRAVVFPHVAPLTGALHDAAGLVRRIHAAGALAVVDGSDFATHGVPPVWAIGSDVYLFSTESAYGPRQGVMALRKRLLSALPPQGPDGAADPMVPAGPDHAQIAACAGLGDYVDGLYTHHFSAGRDAKGRAAEVAQLMRAHARRIEAPLVDWLSARPDLRALAAPAAAERVPILSLLAAGGARAAAERLAEHGIVVGAGDVGAARSLAAHGVPAEHGVLRVSLAHYTAPWEVDRLVAALDRTL